jgi:hypothetical protein
MDIEKLARALRLAAEALEPSTPGEKAQTVEETKPPFEQEKTEDKLKEVTLEDLQELGGSLIRAGKRDAFRNVLSNNALKNLSSCPPESFSKLWVELTEAAK